MSESDTRTKIETILNAILSRRYNADIEIKFVDREGKNDVERRNNNRTGRASADAGERD